MFDEDLNWGAMLMSRQQHEHASRRRAGSCLPSWILMAAGCPIVTDDNCSVSPETQHYWGSIQGMDGGDV